MEQQLRHSTAGGHRAPASRTADSACAERMSKSVDSPVASPTPVCTRWMGWTRLVRSIGRMPVRYSTSSAHNRDQHGDHFRCLWLHGSAHNAVSSRPMAVTECRALLHCMEVHAMRLWPLIERDWLLARLIRPSSGSTNTVVISARAASHIAASGGSKWSSGWASCSLRRLWRYLPGLHQKHSHCTACGCAISSVWSSSCDIAPQAGTEHLRVAQRIRRVPSA